MSDTDDAPLTLSREDLYELVWSKPMSDLAQDFGISDVGLAKRCRRLKVPTPGRGYWARIDAGQKPYQPSLPKREPQVLDYSALTVAPSSVADDTEGTPAPTDEVAQEKADAAWLAERTAFEQRAENLIQVPESVRTWHPTARGTRDDLEQAAKEMRASRKASDAYDKWPASRKAREMCDEAWKWRQAVDRGERLYTTHKPIAFRVSLGTFERALRIVNTLALAASERGFAVREDSKLGRVVFAGHGVDVQLRVSEDLDTKTRPHIRYDGKTEQEKYKIPTGRLRITIQSDWREGPYVADHGPTTLEAKLNRLFVIIYRLIVKHRAHQRKLDAYHRQREEDDRRREEAKRIREEQERQAAEERQRRRALLVEAKRWRSAALLRDYVTHIRATATPYDPATVAWVDWALRVASDLDPTTDRLAGPRVDSSSDASQPASPGSIVLGR
jgi:hypothetical protein